LPKLVQTAGIIFSGRVTSMGNAAPAGSALGLNSGSTTITFQVEHAYRGTAAGRSLTIHEWSGLRDREHYRVGERVLLFLYSPSKLGFTSPVAGAAGRFAIDSQGRVVIRDQNAVALSADPVLGGRKIVPYEEVMRAVRRAGGSE
jgi:hypothetical protein